MPYFKSLIHATHIVQKAAGAVIMNAAGEILLIMRDDMPLWELVGGIVDGDETAEQAFRREALEEIGCETGPLAYLGTHFRPLSGGYQEASFYRTVLVSTPIVLDEHVAYEWFELFDLPYNLVPLHRIVIDSVIGDAGPFTFVDGVSSKIAFSQTLHLSQIYGSDIWKEHPHVVRKRRAGLLRYDPLTSVKATS